MAEFIIMLLFFGLMIAFCYYIYNKDLFAPEVLFLAGFVLAFLAAAMNIREWGIELGFETVIVLVLGAFAFVMGGCLFRATHHANSGNQFIADIIQIPMWKTVAVCVLDLIVFYFYYKDITRIAQFADSYWQSIGVMVAYKQALTYGGYSISSISNYGSKIVYSFGYIYLFVLINNMFSGARKKISIKILPVIMHIAMSILKGNRVDIIALVVAGVFFYYYFWNARYAWKRHVNGKMLKRILIIFSIGIVLFYVMKSLVGRSSSLRFFDYVTQYIGGSIQLLDQYLKDEERNTTVLFGETLSGLITGLNKLGFLDFRVGKQLEFRTTSTGVYLGNVYTAFRRYYNDLEFVGLIVFPMGLSIFMNSMYLKTKRISQSSYRNLLLLIIYGSLVYVLPLQAMEDNFFINKITIGYATEVVILSVCLLFILKKFRIKRR